MKFRKKPVVIEARLFDPSINYGEALDVLNWCNGRAGSGGCIIKTLEGDHLAQFGDWIIKGVKGKFYPCKPDIFEATYEKVED